LLQANEESSVGRPAQWSIGIYEGMSPLQLNPAGKNMGENPVLTAKQVTDVPALFVADPFMVYEQQQWHMFFEVMPEYPRQGVIGWASSRDAQHWTYQRIVLQETFHLSYPYVFAWQGTYYMVPETYEAAAIRLYQASRFPTDWQYVAELYAGAFTDPSLFYWRSMWWMFACSEPFTHDTLCLYYAPTLLGPWQSHPKNPLMQADPHKSRPAGRVVQHGQFLLRYAQDDAPLYGKQVRAFAITTLTTTAYSEVEVNAGPHLQGAGSGWNADGMHHVDAHQLGAERWIACVDGQRGVVDA
jgi:hypothetical protein